MGSIFKAFALAELTQAGQQDQFSKKYVSVKCVDEYVSYRCGNEHGRDQFVDKLMSDRCSYKYVSYQCGDDYVSNQCRN